LLLEWVGNAINSHRSPGNKVRIHSFKNQNQYKKGNLETLQAGTQESHIKGDLENNLRATIWELLGSKRSKHRTQPFITSNRTVADKHFQLIQQQKELVFALKFS
jgi:hypothetical protein